MLAAQAVARVLAGSNLTEALAQLWREQAALPATTRGAVQDLAYSCLRAYGRHTRLLQTLLSRPLVEPLPQAILLVALARLENRPQEAHTIVNQAVEAVGSVKKGAFRNLVNAVLRNFLRQRDALLTDLEQQREALWQHPAWWQDRLRRDWPDHWQAVLAAGNSHPPMTLRVNRRHHSPEAYLSSLAQAGIPARQLGGGALLLERPVPVERLPHFFASPEGEPAWVSVQDAGAQQAARLLDVEDGMRVLDACAAPGGKTAHLLELAPLVLTAIDADAGRLKKVVDNLQRLGLQAKTLAADCRELSAWWDGIPFERILADVPCSATGVVRRHPDIKWLRREADIAGFAATQVGILEALWLTLAVGGKMLYATCSVFQEENEMQVAAFAARHADCLRLPTGNAGDAALGWQLLPNQEHDGFFYALLQKAY